MSWSRIKLSPLYSTSSFDCTVDKSFSLSFNYFDSKSFFSLRMASRTPNHAASNPCAKTRGLQAPCIFCTFYLKPLSWCPLQLRTSSRTVNTHITQVFHQWNLKNLRTTHSPLSQQLRHHMFAFKDKKTDNLLGKEWQLFEPHHKTNP
jgi:hypothetical protein